MVLFSLKTFQDTLHSPQFDLQNFVLTMPITSSQSLALRSTVLQELSFTRFAEAFQKLTADHDKQFNPSGVPFTKDMPLESRQQGTKRNAETAFGPNPLSLAQLDKKKEDLDKPLVELTNNAKYVLIIVADKHVYVLAKESFTLGHEDPLLLAWGEYRTDGDVSTFSKFKAWLEEKGIINGQVQCHKVEGDTIEPSQPCAFKPKSLPAKQAVTWQCPGSTRMQ